MRGNYIGNGTWVFINILFMSYDIVVEYIIYEYLFCVCAAYDGQFFLSIHENAYIAQKES